MKVEAIFFNHDPSSAIGDAITIRRAKGGDVIVAPEFQDGVNEPAAYALKALSSEVTVHAVFSEGPLNATRQIQAIPIGNRSLPWRLVHVGDTRRGATNAVSFDSMGMSAREVFKVIPEEISKVGIHDLILKWEVGHPGSLLGFAETQHVIYLLPELPRAPWFHGTVEPEGRQFPWVHALDKACRWASGTTTISQAIAQVTAAINSQPNQDYDPAGEMFVPHKNDPFHLTEYLQELDGPDGFPNECRGVAAALVTFANLLGANLCPLRLKTFSEEMFHTRPIRPLSSPDFVQFFFSRHEVATRRGAAADDQAPVYDACLQVNQPAPELPVSMPLGHVDPGGIDYRQKLIETGDAESVTPILPRPVI